MSPVTTERGLAPQVRLGVILPSVNTVVEPWFSRVVPDFVAVHATRMLLASPVNKETLARMDHEEGVAAAQRLASCRPHAIAYGCTASSIVQGPNYDRELKTRLEGITGVPCFTAVGAIEEALFAVHARRICVASPYTDAIDHAERAFFEALGFDIMGTANLGIADGFALASPTREDMLTLGRRAWRDGADALLVSCLNMHSQYVVEALEIELGRPVITSTTATLWKLMRAAGLAVVLQGHGRLLAGKGQGPLSHGRAASKSDSRPEEARN